MKFITSLLFLWSIQAHALIIIKAHKAHQAEIVADIFRDKYHIPNELIEIQTSNEQCRSSDKKIVLDLCINKKGELLLLSLDMKMLKHSFQVFRSAHGGIQ
jgi:hypothetical protein